MMMKNMMKKGFTILVVIQMVISILLPTMNVSIVAAVDPAGKKLITSPTTTSSPLAAGTYLLKQNLTGSAGNSAIKVAENSTVVLFVDGNVTLRGGNANGRTGAGAGLEVPESSTLILKGEGSLTAIGGKAGNGLSGDSGGSSTSVGNAPGGAGGAGGGGAGSGIGGKGGDGATGNSSSQSSGNTGGTGYHSGRIILAGNVNVSATGGSQGDRGGAGGAGGEGKKTGGGIGKWDQGHGGGGGGGGGGAGYAAASIGGGGAGGGSGGTGGKGSYSNYLDGDNVHAGGAGGGAGGRGAVYGSGGYGGGGVRADAGSSGSSGGGGGTAGNTSTSNGGFHATSGGSAGSGGTGGNFSKELLYSNINTYQYYASGGSGANGGSASGTKKKIYDVSSFTYTYDTLEFPYSGTSQTPVIQTAVYSPDGKDVMSYFTYAGKNNVNAGTATLSIIGIDNWNDTFVVTGDYNVPYEILPTPIYPTIEFTGLQIDDVTGKQYIGYGESFFAQVVGNHGLGEVTWSVIAGSAKLEKSGTNGVNITPQSVQNLVLKAEVAPANNYAYGTVNSDAVEVKQRNIAGNVTIESIPPQSYIGAGVGVEPKPKVTDVDNKDKTTLVENIDFVYRYENNIDSTDVSGALAIVHVDGINNYYGTSLGTFTINKINFVKSFLKVIDGKEAPDVWYNAEVQTSDPEIYYKGYRLVKDRDYRLEPGESNIEVSADGAPAVEKVVGLNNFTGEFDISFRIIPRPIGDQDIKTTENAKDVIFDGTNQETSEPTLRYKNKTLTKGIDYLLKYVSETTKEEGTAKIIVQGINSFSGERLETFKILKRALSVTANKNQWKYYGMDDPLPFTYSYSNDVAGYVPTFVGLLSREGINTIEGNALGSYKITRGTVELDAANDTINHNYKIAYEPNYFTIKEYDPKGVEASLDGEMGKNNWYINQVKIVAPTGYKISLSNRLDEDNQWEDYVVMPDGDYTKKGVTYFLRNVSSPTEMNAITVARQIPYKQDTVRPSGSIVVETDAWTKLLEDIPFDLFYNTTIIAKIYGGDRGSQVYSTSYLESEKELTQDELKAIPYEEDGVFVDADIKWTEGKVTSIKGKKGIVYTRIEDFAGNVSFYSTEGLVYDTTKPILSAEYDFSDVWTMEENPLITGAVYDALAGLKDRYVTYTIDGHEAQAINVDEDTSKFTIQHLPDGNYNLLIEAKDKAGNEADPISFHVMKDTVTPIMQFKADTSTISQEQTIQFTPVIGASGVKKIEYYNEETGAWETVKNAMEQGFKVTENGTYTFRVYNVAGAVSESASITFNSIDTKQPKVKIWGYLNQQENDVYQEGTWTNKDVTIAFKNEENNLGTSIYEWKINNGSYQKVNASNGVAVIEHDEIKEGIHSISVKITSEAGMVSEEVVYQVRRDITNPKGEIQVKDDTFTSVLHTLTFDLLFKETQTASIKAFDVDGVDNSQSDIDKVEYYIYKSDENKKLPSAPTTIDAIEALVHDEWKSGKTCSIEPNATYVVYAKISDVAGNTVYLSSNGLLLDNESPTLQIDYPYDGKWTYNASIHGDVSDNLAGIGALQYKVDDGTLQDLSINNNRFTISGIEQGKHIVTVLTKDAVGNETWSNGIHVWQDPESPTIQVTSQDNGSTYEMVDIDAKHQGESGLAQVLVKLDDGEWEDITDSWEKGYKAIQNGQYTFRAISHAGISADATYEFMNIVTGELQPEVTMYDRANNRLKDGDATNSNVTFQFANNPANTKGLEYYYRRSPSNDWVLISATKGVVSILETQEGVSTYEFKLVNTATNNESKIVSATIEIDRTLPNGKIEIKDTSSQWNDFLNTITFSLFYQNEPMFEIDAIDDDSGLDPIKGIQYFIRSEDTIPSDFVSASEIEEYVKGRWQNNAQGYLPTGKAYIVYAKINDRAGNVRYLSTDGLVVDDVSPIIESETDLDQWIITNEQEVNVKVNDHLAGINDTNGTLSYSINNGLEQMITSLTDGIFTLTGADFLEGINVLKVHAEDKASNKNTAVFNVKKDSVVPEIHAESENLTSFASENTITMKPVVGDSGVDKLEILYPEQNEWLDISDSKIEGSSTLIYQYKVNESGLYKIRLTNGAGVSSVEEVTVINVDSLSPEVVLTATDKHSIPYLSNSWTSQEVNISVSNASVNVGDDVYEYSIGNSDHYQPLLPNAKGEHIVNVHEEGIQTIYFRITSSAGVVSPEVSFTVCKDNTGPQFEAGMIDDHTNYQLLSIIANDNGSGVATYHGYSFDGGKTWQTSFTMTYYESQYVDVRVKDNVGNISYQRIKVSMDELAPNMKYAKQDTNKWAYSKIVEALLYDPIDEEGLSYSSGIKSSFITSKNPFKNGKISKTVPSASDYMMKTESGDVWNSYTISEALDSFDEDNFWIVVNDHAGNTSAYSVLVDKIKEFEEPSKPDKPNQPDIPIDPEKPISPINPNDPSMGKDDGKDNDYPSISYPDGVKPKDEQGMVDYLEDLLDKPTLSQEQKDTILEILNEYYRSQNAENANAKLEDLIDNGDIRDPETLTALKELLKGNQKTTEAQQVNIIGWLIVMIGLVACMLAYRNKRKYKKEVKEWEAEQNEK